MVPVGDGSVGMAQFSHLRTTVLDGKDSQILNNELSGGVNG